MNLITVHQISDIFGSGRTELQINPASIIAVKAVPLKIGVGSKITLPVLGEVLVEESIADIAALAGTA